jgi:hypothetical protein
MSRFARALSVGLVALALAASPALAQDEVAAEGEGGSSGNPLYAYVATAFLGAGVIFVLCKSARR